MAPPTTVGKTSSILFVCLGNICRSPMAEGVFRSLAQQTGLDRTMTIDSAGTGAWHVGDPPDPRAVAKAAEHGVDISGQRARQFAVSDFERFDLILAMDASNLETLKSRSPDPFVSGAHRFMEFALDEPIDVPDPYYGGADGFETVYRMLENGCSSILKRLG
ncbi:low molecular weight protein-tyrosine-phosphatase [Hoeflea poritis]|uniref:protein-tyrosine-phosphatase n=1 Tax=Hoeflea poritis TaxID=2993659 RepID=A0ABT4VLG4_9HYPH|nr:low molecular weight protein-tyrosine-phosphatase [Hoeflea poritis]MDA4845516.1 low molecular weight phosphotyrosine protein phosphatase [Hoeflea poritis]